MRRFAWRLFPVLLLLSGATWEGACSDSRTTGHTESSGTETPRARARNVLLISIDALRADHLGCHGYPRQVSRNIDRLCRAGWVFEAAYAVTPRTGPSVASLHTGVFPSKLEEWKVPGHSKTLAELLSERGYATVAAVDNANLSREFGYARGFDVYRETWNEETESELTRTDLITDTAVMHLKRLAGEERPFFMWLHYVNPHTPYTPPPDAAAPFLGDTLWQQNDVTLPVSSEYVNAIRRSAYLEGHDRVSHYIAQYDGEIVVADRHVGRVVDLLATFPSLRDTLIVITADHGESLGEGGIYFKHGPALTEPNVRIPLIFHLAGAASPHRIPNPVALIDVAPTILELLGIQAPDSSSVLSRSPLAGESLAPFIEGRPSSREPYLFLASRDFWAVRARHLKLIVQTREKSEVPSEPYQLYDLNADAGETRNLFADQPETARRLVRILEQRRAIQEEVADNPTEDYKHLSKEALENLRSLGYIR